jgi:all-trans-retinol 13,14-reductase
MLTRYSPALSKQVWDAIIIGSGIGGLATACILAKEGWKVLVLEQHYEPGGFCHTFKRKEFEWDVGVHYVGGVHRETSVERRIFDYVSNRQLQWATMGSPYDVAIIDGKRYDFVPGSEAQIKQWIGYFPKEEKAICAYWAAVRDAVQSQQNFFAERALPSPLAAIAGGFMKRRFLKHASQTVYEFLRGLTKNEDLITLLCTQCGDYGLPPGEASFAIHAMVVHHYRDGGSYPVGGASAIPRSIVKTIEEHGGEVALRCSVDHIRVERRGVSGVRLANGAVIEAETIISDAGVRATHDKLLLPGDRERWGIEAALAAIKPSTGHLCLYVGLEGTAAALKLPKYNYWCYDPYTGDGSPGGRLPSAYISFPSAKDPAWEREHPGKSTVQLIGLGRPEDFAAFDGSKWHKRPKAYEAIKESFQEEMLERLYTLHPKTKGKVAWAEVSTPLSTAHFTGHAQGEIYGLEHTPARFKQDWLRPRTPIHGLYLTGQDICTAGVCGALFSAVLTSSAIMGRNMVSRILKTPDPF